MIIVHCLGARISLECLFEGTKDQFVVVALAKFCGDDPIAVQIDDGTEVDFPLVGLKFGDVGAPLFVDFCCREVPIEEILCRLFGVYFFVDVPFFPCYGFDAHQFHPTVHALVIVRCPVFPAKGQGHLAISINSVGFFVNGHHSLAKFLILLLLSTMVSLQILIMGLSRYSGDSAK